MKLIASILFLLSLSALSSINIYASPVNPDASGISFAKAYALAQTIALVRIESAEFKEGARPECKFRYKTSTIYTYKGEKVNEFYSGNIAVVGNRYLLMADVENSCDRRTVNINLSTLPTMYPLLPYGSDLSNKDTWVAMGTANFDFPLEIRTSKGNPCYVPTDVGVATPCLESPPVVRFSDLDELLKSFKSSP